MIFYDVYVKDRLTEEEMCVGSLLVKVDASELMSFLSKYNATDLEFIRKEVKV